jgi:hypothetical protein
LPPHLPPVSASEEDEDAEAPEPADGFRRPTPIRHRGIHSSTTRPRTTYVYKQIRHPSASLQPPARAPATREAGSGESTPTLNGGCTEIAFGSRTPVLPPFKKIKIKDLSFKKL